MTGGVGVDKWGGLRESQRGAYGRKEQWQEEMKGKRRQDGEIHGK
jgi:hypothetical protein